MDYLCIDLKCFYASCECVDRHVDPLTTPLVVADSTRGKGAICLAVSPKMKELNVRNRCRLFEIPSNISYIIAKPRMQRYIDMSAYIYSIYLKYVSKDDIYVYSIDEVFINITSYEKLYGKDAIEIGKMIIEDVYKTTGIKATCGVGSNLFLCKIAMDIIAKHNCDNIGYLDEKLFKEKLWDYSKLTDFWQIGTGIAKRLNKLNLYTLKDVANCDKDILYKEFGVNASFLIDHSNGIDKTTIEEIKNYIPLSKSISSGQVLDKDYPYEDTILVVKEMIDGLVLDLISKRLITGGLSIAIGYSESRKTDTKPKMNVKSKKLVKPTNSYKEISRNALELFAVMADKSKLIRQINISFSRLTLENEYVSDLLENSEELEKERKALKAIIDIKNKFGKSTILRGMSLDEKATMRKRNKLIGGHNAE